MRKTLHPTPLVRPSPILTLNLSLMRSARVVHLMALVRRWTQRLATTLGLRSVRIPTPTRGRRLLLFVPLGSHLPVEAGRFVRGPPGA